MIPQPPRGLAPGAGATGNMLTTSDGTVVSQPPPGGYPPPPPGSGRPPEPRPPIPEPPGGEEINKALYNATRFTGNPAQTHTIPAPLADLDADNLAFAQVMIARWSNGITLWVAGQLQLSSREVHNSLPATRERLAQNLARIFAGRGRMHSGIYGQPIYGSSLRDFMRIALQGAQVLTAHNTTAEITAASTGSGLQYGTPAYRAWRDNFSAHATAWMQERQALDWAIVPEIIAGLPLQARQFTTVARERAPMVAADVVKWYGRETAPVFMGDLYRSLMSERNPAYRRAGKDGRLWPTMGIAGANVAPDLIVYAWDGWREELSNSNRVACYALTINLQADTLQQLCGEYGVRPDLDDKQKIIAIAETWATYATESSTSIMVQVARDGEAQGLPSRKSLKALEDAALSFGAGGFFQDLWNGIKRIARHVSDWFRDLGRKLGAFFQVIGREVRRWARIPFIGDLFVIATGIEFVFGTVLPELGRCMQTGKISSFRLKELGFGVGRLLDRAGRAIAMAAPFLPPPFNLAAGIVGALSVTVGMTITALMNAENVKKRTAAYNAAQDADFQKRYAEAEATAQADAARRQLETEMAQDAAYDTLLAWMQREGTLGEGMLDRSKNLALGGVTGFRKIALAATGAIALGFAGYLATRKA